MISNLDINSLIATVVLNYELKLESIKGYKELDDALSCSRWKFENLEKLCRKWIEQEFKISQIKFLLQNTYSSNDYNIVYNLFRRILDKKIKKIRVDIKINSIEEDFG